MEQNLVSFHPIFITKKNIEHHIVRTVIFCIRGSLFLGKHFQSLALGVLANQTAMRFVERKILKANGGVRQPLHPNHNPRAGPPRQVLPSCDACRKAVGHSQSTGSLIASLPCFGRLQLHQLSNFSS